MTYVFHITLWNFFYKNQIYKAVHELSIVLSVVDAAAQVAQENPVSYTHLTNPLLNSRSPQLKALRKNGFQVAEFRQIFHL